MARRSHASRLSDIVMDELAGEQTPWDLDKHLSGCLAGYQTDQSYGAAVYFALEALSGIAHDVAVRANAGKLDADQLDMDWIISPDTNLPVPWIWIRALSAAWERYTVVRVAEKKVAKIAKINSKDAMLRSCGISQNVGVKVEKNSKEIETEIAENCLFIISHPSRGNFSPKGGVAPPR